MTKDSCQKISIYIGACIAFALYLSIYSCSNRENTTIGMLFPNLIANERFPKDSMYFYDEIKKRGGKVIVMNAHTNEQLQMTQAQELIAEGVKVLVLVAVNKNTAGSVVRLAQAHHIKVIAYERIISNCIPDFFISFDNIKVGELMATYVLKLKSEGKYFLLGGDKRDQNALWVKQGQLNIIKPYIQSGKIKIVYDTFIESWNADNAFHEVTKYLDLSCNDIPDVILSAYDGLSTGAIRAFENNNIDIKSNSLITGQNAEVQACKNIVNGKQKMTVYKSVKKLAMQAADIAWKMAKNETIETGKKIFNGTADIPAILIDPVSIDNTNIREVIEDGFLNESQIYGDK